MSDPRPTREQLIALAKREPEVIADLVLSLWSRVKRGKALNLLHRLDKRPCEIMVFFALPEASIPYDNNQAERDLRMMKVREKISGTFRSEEHGRAFCELRGIVSSVRKQGRDMLASLKELVLSPAKLGKSLAAAEGT